MATINIAKKSATTKIAAGDSTDAGVGVVSGDLYVHDGTAARKVSDAADAYVVGVASGYKVVGGQITTAAASTTVATGLATVVAVMVGMETDPADTEYAASGQVGNQAGAPVAGSVIIKTWKFTNVLNDATPTASTSFGAKVNWIAVGT